MAYNDQSSGLWMKIMAFIAIVVLIVGALLSSQLIESNSAGYIQVKQAAGTGTMTVRLNPGVYAQNFADIHTYRISDVYDFHGADDRIKVQFNTGATAVVSGQIKYRLPLNEDKILLIHRDFRSYEAVQSDLVRQVVAASLKQSASQFSADDVYSNRRSEFINLVNEQIKNGIYATTYTETLRKDEDGNTFIQRSTATKRDANGVPVIAERSAFDVYGIELVQLVINDIEFDEQTKGLIARRKEAEQEQVVARATAERSKQDAITAEAKGKANVAIAEAEALVKKKTAVIEAEKETEVAQQQALQAMEQKKAIVAKGEAEAEAARLKVAAGLTPQEKAKFDMDTAIGVADKLSKIQLPKMMVLGGGANGQSPLNPFDAVGLKSFIDISKQIADQGDNANSGK